MNVIELGITAGSGSLVLLLLGSVVNAFRKKEDALTAHPVKLVAIVAPFVVLAVEPWLVGPVGTVFRYVGAGLFAFLFLAVIYASKEQKKWARTDYLLAITFTSLAAFGAARLLSGV